MALGNVLGAPYSIVAEVHYNRSDKQVSFNLEMYTGSDKSEMFSSIAYSLSAANPAVSIGGVITDYPADYSYSAAPADFDSDKWKTFAKYIIGSGGKAGTDLAGQEGNYFLCPYGDIIKAGVDDDNPDGTSWSYNWLVTDSDRSRIHTDSAGKLWKINFDSGSVTELPSETFIPATWDTFFEVSVMDKKDTNIIKQCYEYLKSLSAFDSATDL